MSSASTNTEHTYTFQMSLHAISDANLGSGNGYPDGVVNQTASLLIIASLLGIRTDTQFIASPDSSKQQAIHVKIKITFA